MIIIFREFTRLFPNLIFFHTDTYDENRKLMSSYFSEYSGVIMLIAQDNVYKVENAPYLHCDIQRCLARFTFEYIAIIPTGKNHKNSNSAKEINATRDASFLVKTTLVDLFDPILNRESSKDIHVPSGSPIESYSLILEERHDKPVTVSPLVKMRLERHINRFQLQGPDASLMGFTHIDSSNNPYTMENRLNLSKMIKDYVTQPGYQWRERGKRPKRCPSMKMFLYANAIADKLNIERPCGDFVCFFDFISANKTEYNNVTKGKQEVIQHQQQDNADRTYTGIHNLSLRHLKGKSGIYAFVSNGEVVYIGKSSNLGNRIHQSFGVRSKSLKIDRILYRVVPNEADTNVLEVVLISEYHPILNKESNQTNETPQLFKSGINILNDFTELVFLPY